MRTMCPGLLAAVLLSGCMNGSRKAPTRIKDPPDAAAGDENRTGGDHVGQLPEFAGQSYGQLLKRLGPPTDKTGYTIANAPTKGWNHAALFARYPKNDENKGIHIMETTWDAGEYQILACFHVVQGENRCLVAMRIKKGVMF